MSLEALSGLQDPIEIALLARNLEKEAPGVYQHEAMQAASNALLFWLGSKEQVDVRPLFELLRDLGGNEAATTLEQFTVSANPGAYPQGKNVNIPSAWQVYSLIALSSLPDGEGVSTLAGLAADPNIPVERKSVLPFRMLAQSTLGYDEAGKALVDLVQAKQIPDQAWSVVADALAGKYLQFPSELSGGAMNNGKDTDKSGIESPFLGGAYDNKKNINYEVRLVSADWSAKQIKQQVALIEDLLKVTSSPAAVAALQQARATLQRNS